MKRVYLNLWMLALMALASCGGKNGNASENGTLKGVTDSVEVVDVQKEATSQADVTSDKAEIAKIVKLRSTAPTMYYDEESGKVGDVSDNLAPGYYNYQGETKEYYLVCLGQDGPYTIPRKDAEIITWTAAEGHGYVLMCNEKHTTVLMKAKPADDSKTIESFQDPDGIPECAECLAVSGEWYKVKFEGKTGYVKRTECEWNISSADACGDIR